MTELDIAIRNGTVVTAADTFKADVGIRGGKVVALAPSLAGARETIDAQGKLVLPGGIDSHVHLDEPPFGGVLGVDDFESGTRSAACGGTTTIIPFAQQERGTPLRSSIEAYREKARGKAIIDYAFHTILVDANERVLGQELPALIADGYTSFKLYMTYAGLAVDDSQILRTLKTARAEGALVMIHAENDHCIHFLAQELELAGRTTIADYPGMAPKPVEREATHRAITLSEIVDVPVLLVHVSADEAMDQIRWGQTRGLEILAETCPQYLFISEDAFNTPGWEGSKYLCAPPPRESENQRALWRGLGNGTFQVFSSDHCSFLFEGPAGKRIGGGEPHFHRIPPGVPGLETRLPLLFSEGVRKGRIDLNTFVALASTNAAKIYGLYPRKGTIVPGGDADLAVWDPEREVEISIARLHDNMDYTPYEGMSVTGWPEITISRGEVVCRDGEVLGAPGRGQFLPCDRMAWARSAD